METEAGIGVTWPEAQECPGLLATARGWKRQESIPYRFQGECGPADTLTLDFWPPDCERTNFCC